MNNHLVWEIARQCHETNRAYCMAIGDFSQPEWEAAPQWQKDSAYKGVDFHLKHPDAKPEDSHNSWLAEKEKDGWKYGPVKNPETKEHPCFVPYQQLPSEQKAKDYLFIQTVKNSVRLIGIDLIRIAEKYEGKETLGQFRVRQKLNIMSGGLPYQIKAKTADIIDLLSVLRERIPNDLDGFQVSEQNRVISEAMTNYENACHWGVKAATTF